MNIFALQPDKDSVSPQRHENIARDVTLIERSSHMSDAVTSHMSVDGTSHMSDAVTSTATDSGFVADFNLLEESMIQLPQSMVKSRENDVAAGLPDGWAKKSNAHGQMFWVHLQSGAYFIFKNRCFYLCCYLFYL